MAAIGKSITVGFLMLGLITALGLAAGSGCANHSQKWYGTWEGDLDRTDPSIPDDDVKRTIDRLRVTIRPDGTFEMIESGVNTSGTYELGEEEASLTITKLLGKRIEDTGSATQKQNLKIKLRWQADGTLVWSDPGAIEGHPVRLTRRAQPSK